MVRYGYMIVKGASTRMCVSTAVKRMRGSWVIKTNIKPGKEEGKIKCTEVAILK